MSGPSWDRIGLALTMIYAAVASLNYPVQLIVVSSNIFGGEPQGLALVAMGNPRSLFWGLTILGYSTYMALVAVWATPALVWARWGRSGGDASTAGVKRVRSRMAISALQP